MLISIVIPTRDRIGLLADAIATIIPQNGWDCESASLTMLRLTQYANTFTLCRSAHSLRTIGRVFYR